MGEDFLPYAILPVTSTICEVRYGNTRKFKIHYKDDKKVPEEINLKDPEQGESYIVQLNHYLAQSDHRDQGSQFKKIEVYWPHELLQVRRFDDY